MNDDQLLRYSRQIMLPEIDVEGQQKLLGSRCLIIGMGGLGSPAAMYLAAAGTGTLILNDFDQVDLSNLQRQVIHGTDDIGKEKVISANQTLRALNPDTCIEIRHQRLSGNELTLEVEAADVVLDCSDNFSTRFAVNQACVKTKTPLVSGAAIRFEGQVTVFNPLKPSSPCYNCLYADINELSETCAQNGVIAPLTGAIGSIQAFETIKFICGIGEPLVGRLLLLDGLTMEWHRMQFPKDPACPTCSLSV